MRYHPILLKMTITKKILRIVCDAEDVDKRELQYTIEEDVN
jgi:hypothetical protein